MNDNSQSTTSEAREPGNAVAVDRVAHPATANTKVRVPELNFDLPEPERAREATRVAEEVFAQTEHWIEFYRLVLGTEGIVDRLYPSTEARSAFEKTPQYEQLLEMVTGLRSAESGKGDTLEPQRMITVRLPVSLHAALTAEAERHGTSINKLCISKLISGIDPRFVPEEKGKRRGRRPGPQGPRRTRNEPEHEEHEVISEKVARDTDGTVPRYGEQ